MNLQAVVVTSGKAPRDDVHQCRERVCRDTRCAARPRSPHSGGCSRSRLSGLSHVLKIFASVVLTPGVVAWTIDECDSKRRHSTPRRTTAPKPTLVR